jgi:predicted nicotinamide N-methyase
MDSTSRTPLNRASASHGMSEQAIREELGSHFPLRTFPLVVGGITFSITTAEDMELLIGRITEEEFSKDERLPYWAEVWHSALALGEFLQEHPELVAGRDVHEIGCGLGVPGITAARLGARITFSDYEEHALLAARLNFLENFPGGTAEFLSLDFRKPPARCWPVILASDVIYERRFTEPLAVFLDSVTAPGGTIVLAEPDREIAAAFFEKMSANGYSLVSGRKSPYLYDRSVTVSVHVLTKPGPAI